MKGKKQYLAIFLRTLAAFMAFWLLMVGVLTVRNRNNQVSALQDNHQSAASLLARNVEEVRNGAADPGMQDVIITWRMSSASYYTGRYLSVSRLFDEAGNEVARSQLAIGSITMPGTFTYDHFILFDPVLTDEEQIALAECLRAEDNLMTRFYGSAYQDWGAVPNFGLYGEVTGIRMENNVIYPQKLVYYYEDGPVVLMESGHEMFEGAELTTLRFDAAQITSALAWGDVSPKELLELHEHANLTIDKMIGKQSSVVVSRGSRSGGWYYPEEGIPIAYAYSYIPWRIATYDLNFPYVATLLAALLAAIWVSWMQIKMLKRERQLTRSIAHELKTPVAILRAYAESLKEDAVPEKRQEYLAAIVEESDRLAVLVNEVLDLSRMEGSVGVLTKESVNLTVLVRDGFERLRAPMWEKSLALVLNLEPITLEGDPKRLGQVVNNLAVNALNYASEGGVHVTLKREGERAVLTMRNNCLPMWPEQLKRLWDPFYKLDESRSGEGSGLGLAVVKNIVELHGGTCRAESLPDGIRFVMELPC